MRGEKAENGGAIFSVKVQRALKAITKEWTRKGPNFRKEERK